MLSLKSFRDDRLSSSIIFRALAERDSDAVLSTKWRGLAMAEEGVAKACDAGIIDELNAPNESDEILDTVTLNEALEAAEFDAAADAGVLLAAVSNNLLPSAVAAAEDDSTNTPSAPAILLNTETEPTSAAATSSTSTATGSSTCDENCPLEWPLAMLWLEKRALSHGKLLRKYAAEAQVSTLGGAGVRAAFAISLRHQNALVALARHELSIEDYTIDVAALGIGFFTKDERIVAPMI